MDSNATKLLWKKFTEIFKQKKDTPKRHYMWDCLLLLNKSIQKVIPMSYTTDYLHSSGITFLVLSYKTVRK